MAALPALLLAGCMDSIPSDDQAQRAFVDSYGGPGNLQINSFQKVYGKSTELFGSKGYTYYLKANVKWINGLNTRCIGRYAVLDTGCLGVPQNQRLPPGSVQDVTAEVSFTKTENGWQTASGRTY